MPRSKSQLLFPERRRHVRVFTLVNFGGATIVVLLAFVGINIRSEMRGRDARDYGRLLNSHLPKEVEQKPVEVVKEAPPPVDDQTSADPMLVAPMAREQWLHGELQTTPVSVTTAGALLPAPRPGDADVAIVGGPEGVEVVQQTRRKPVLKGGFGRN